MKKIYSFVGIVLIIIALTVFSQYATKQKVTALTEKLSATEAFLQQEDFAHASVASENCISYLLDSQSLLRWFIRNESLNAISVSLHGMACYSKEENRTEALAELARARTQLAAMSNLFFRTI